MDQIAPELDTFDPFREMGKLRCSLLVCYDNDIVLNPGLGARVAAPLVKSATIHGEHGNIGNTFLYVFQHVTKYGYYPEVRKKNLTQ